VYITPYGEEGGYCTPCMYDIDKDKWFVLPELPYINFSLVAVPEKKHLLAIGGVRTSVTNKVFLWDEQSHKWLTPYPNMPTARCHCSGISYGSSVIVAGGVTSYDPFTLTSSVEVLHIYKDFSRSYWSVVKQLPFGMSNSIPLIIDDKLYIAGGYDIGGVICNMLTASLPQLLQSSNNTSSGQVWNKLPDMPYSSQSINHYQGRLITFAGADKVEQPGNHLPTWKSVPLIHVYNAKAKSWDCVGENPFDYYFGYSVHLQENKILFLGGLTGTYNTGEDDDLITACMLLTLTP